jgi:dethiobiotin synthase
MTPTFLVCGTDTEVGKTVLSALLLRHLRDNHKEVRYLKPMQTGPESDTSMVRKLAELSKAMAPDPILSLPTPASIDQAAKIAGVHVTAKQILHGIQKKQAQAPGATWVIESAGGLRVPLNEEEEQIDVLQQLHAPVVLAARSGLGTLNHTLLTAEALERRGIPLNGIVLFGEPHLDNVHSLENRLPNTPILDFPWFKELTPAALDLALGVHDFGQLIS